jgi:NTP pyrophosphatase (non-canonical NTP hydrolase)
MELPRYQQQVAALIESAGLASSAPISVLDLASEVGELAKEALKGTRYGTQPFAAPPGWSEELGDVFFSLICAANATGVDLEAALDQVLAKCRERLARTGTIESGR